MLAIRQSATWTKGVKLLLGFAVLAGIVYGFTLVTVKADTIDWTTNDPSGRVQTDLAPPPSEIEYRGCVKQSIEVAAVDSTSSTTDTICVYQADGFRYGVLDKIVRSGCCSSYHDTSFVVAYPSDTKMYRVAGMPISDLVPMINSRHVIWRDYQGSGHNFHLTIVKNFRDKLTQIVNGSGVSYELKPGATESLLHDENNTPVNTNAANTSTNGKWLVAELRVGGLARIDLSTFEVKRFSDYTPTYGQGSDGNIEFAVSDSGRYIATTGLNIDSRISDLGSSCGFTGLALETERGTLPNPCPEKLIHAIVDGTIGGDLRTIHYPKFDSDEGELMVYASPFFHPDRPYEQQWVTLTAHGYVQPPRLDYLALGDSYSSGEGDLRRYPNGASYYLAGTDITGNYAMDIPEEKCHISQGSYPFLLARDMRLTSNEMKSIACSGAVRTDIQGSDKRWDSENYHYTGQDVKIRGVGTPRLEPLSEQTRTSMQNVALTNFRPGRIQQVEFLRRYKPKAVTLTLGGNDAGFGDIIQACITKINGLADTTCEKALESGRKELGGSLRSQFYPMRDVYQSLRDASPTTKIFVVGYPQFISSTLDYCGSNIPLNGIERKMMTEGVTYMNQVIKAAASAAGVYYVDVENAFSDHVLCSLSTNEKYVNGISDGLRSDVQELFHPNSKGHQAIFDRIKVGLNGQNLLTFSDCSNSIITCPNYGSSNIPDVPEYLNPTSDVDRLISFAGSIRSGVQGVTDHAVRSVKKGVEYIARLNPTSLRPTSIGSIQIQSEPIELATFTIGADGNLNIPIAIPNSISLGYHTVHIYGESYSGEKVEYLQIIEVQSADASDIDGNGIPDSQQSCLYIRELNIDTDLDAIDDACDPEITPTPQLYRVRPGNPSRTYNSSPEHANYLYIERNTHASSVTGITGDYDPDNDGWAIVGASQDASNIPDTGPAANFIVTGEGVDSTPYLYIRAGDYGCVSYTPKSLAKVKNGQSRALKHVAKNTSGCRQESPSDDVDNNGLPDNTQPLYAARNGDPTKGENPSKIYLFRNFHAAEARLGISDSSPTGTAAGRASEPIQEWNLLASSKEGTSIPPFNKLVILTDSDNTPLPTILTKKPNGLCVAYQPNSTGIIKIATQSTRKLVKLSRVPGGQYCE